MQTLAHIDWQTLVTLGIGLVALVHLLRRWWPAATRRAGRTGTSCGVSAESSATGASGCSTGCGQCGQAAATASKDHRTAQPVTWHPRTTR